MLLVEAADAAVVVVDLGAIVVVVVDLEAECGLAPQLAKSTTAAVREVIHAPV
jgi:hypothetical protein